MKKALAGPAKRASKRKPKRRAMIAAVRRRIAAAPGVAMQSTRKVDRAANRLLERAWPLLERLWQRLLALAGPPARRGKRVARRIHATAGRLLRWTGRRLRPAAVLLFRLLSVLERGVRRSLAAAVRAATRVSAVLTPRRAICAAIAASAACLAVSQFVDYRAVEVGQPGYAGLPGATPPTVGGEHAGQPHLYILLPLALLAAALAGLALRTGTPRLGRFVLALGLLSLAVVLLVDLPAGLDASSQASRFSGTNAVLDNGFYAELASTAGLMLGGLLLARGPRRARARRRPGGLRLTRSRRRRRWAINRQDSAPTGQADEGLPRPALRT
jgi:hypothetical protein